MKTLRDYTDALKGNDTVITLEHLKRIRQVFIDHHKGEADGALVVATLVQYIDLMLEACERDIERRD